MIVIPKDYHIMEDLEKARVLCISHEEALREDIRALRIGILNIMPKAENYEFSLLHPLGRSVMQIEPIWIRFKNHTYSSSNQSHIDNYYITFGEAIRYRHLDGLILTGAPVEEMPFEEVSYWNEIVRILKYARKNIASTLGLCWGGLALAKFLGIEKEVYKKKIFGVYETKNINRYHRITGDLDDVFWCPQSRHSGISKEVMEEEQQKGNINLLAYSKEAGYTIFESTDQRFLMHLGHFEYEPQRLIDEYLRDKGEGRKGVMPPQNFNLEDPINRWRGNRTEFFSQWIKYIHETTTY